MLMFFKISTSGRLLNLYKMGDFGLVFDTSSSSSSSEDEENIVIRRPKIYRPRQYYFTKYDDMEFFDRFRLTKNTVLALLQEIDHLIRSPTNRGGCIQPMEQLLMTLRFYASGNLLISVGDYLGVSKMSASRIIRRVSSAIASLSPQYIKMPETNQEMERTATEFYSIASFPRVIGAIDCTLIKIDSVGGPDAEIYRSRKGYFCLNVQTISDASLKIRNVVARWPGSGHDQTIFNNSRVKHEFENGRYGRYMLVGDSGYGVEPYLMTKLHHVHTEAENLYNESIIRTRNSVERQYGVWKRRFPILRFGMRVKLPSVMTIIVATAVLHNIAIDMNENIPEEWLDIDENGDDENDGDHNNANIGIAGRNIRQLIINEHFANL